MFPNKNDLIQIELSWNKVENFLTAKELNPNYSAPFDENIVEELIYTAMNFRVGAGVKKDINQAIKYLREAIKLGSGKAASNLGDIFKIDSWWDKSSYDYNADELYNLAQQLWEVEVKNGSSDAAWDLYHARKRISQNEARKWSSIAIELAKKSGDLEKVTFMEGAYQRDQISKLRNYDLIGMGSAIKGLEFYFELKKDSENWYVGSSDREKDEEEMRLYQKVLSEKINSINRSFNAEEKKEIERLRNLCKKEV